MGKTSSRPKDSARESHEKLPPKAPDVKNHDSLDYFSLDFQLYESAKFGQVEKIIDLVQQGAKNSEFWDDNQRRMVDCFDAAACRACRVSDIDLEQMNNRVIEIIRPVLQASVLYPGPISGVVMEYCLFDRLGTLRLLFQCGLAPTSSRCLFSALEFWDDEAVQFLLARDPLMAKGCIKRDNYSEDTEVPILYALRRVPLPELAEKKLSNCVQVLLDSHADPALPESFMTACSMHDVDLLRTIMKAADPAVLTNLTLPNTGYSYRDGYTGLLVALRAAHNKSIRDKTLAVVQTLLDGGMKRDTIRAVTLTEPARNPMIAPWHVPPDDFPAGSSALDMAQKWARDDPRMQPVVDVLNRSLGSVPGQKEVKGGKN
jgi:hypothetical protein